MKTQIKYTRAASAPGPIRTRSVRSTLGPEPSRSPMTPFAALPFAQAKDFLASHEFWMMVGLGILLLFGLFSVLIFFSFLRLWIQCFLTGAKIGIWDLVGMKLRNVDYGMI